MKRFLFFTFASALLLSGCEYTRKVTETVNYKGQTFTVTRTSEEDAFYDSSEDYRYTVIFPDGTRESTYSYDSNYSARSARNRLMDRWIEQNPSRKPTQTAVATGTGSKTEKDNNRGD